MLRIGAFSNFDAVEADVGVALEVMLATVDEAEVEATVVAVVDVIDVTVWVVAAVDDIAVVVSTLVAGSGRLVDTIEECDVDIGATVDAELRRSAPPVVAVEVTMSGIVSCSWSGEWCECGPADRCAECAERPVREAPFSFNCRVPCPEARAASDAKRTMVAVNTTLIS